MAVVAKKPPVVWHGTQDEALALVDALARNCTCQFGMMNVRLSTCPGHTALVEDQGFLDRLLFERRDAARLRAEEWAGEPYEPLPDDWP